MPGLTNFRWLVTCTTLSVVIIRCTGGMIVLPVHTSNGPVLSEVFWLHVFCGFQSGYRSVFISNGLAAALAPQFQITNGTPSIRLCDSACLVLACLTAFV